MRAIKQLALFTLFTGLSLSVSAQALKNIDVYLMYPKDTNEAYVTNELPRSFFVYDELAENLMDELEPKGKKGSYRAKVEVDGFEGPLKLRLSEGYRNDDGTEMKTFGTKYYRSEQREALLPGQHWGVHIYVNESKWRRQPAITSPEEELNFVRYLQGFL